VADATGTTVWRWDQAEPFGDSPADENPSGTGSFDLPLRLPGQYYDAESGLHYNYFRDYVPGLGRYVETDPIGLQGGINPYLYAEGNPLAKSDPTGEDPSYAAIAGWTGGITAGEAQGSVALRSAHAEFNKYWNTPDPCTREYLRKNHPWLLDFVATFSVGSYVAGPWNMYSGGANARVKHTIYAQAIKSTAKAVLKRKFPKAINMITKRTKYVGAMLALYATYENFSAYYKSLGNCECKSKLAP